jgi:hypothetical protein
MCVVPIAPEIAILVISRGGSMSVRPLAAPVNVVDVRGVRNERAKSLSRRQTDRTERGTVS